MKWLSTVTSFMASNKRKRRGKSAHSIDHATFLQMLTDEFPEVPQAFDKYSQGLLHCEMGVLARLSQEAMDQERWWQVDKYVRFIARVRARATPEVENAIDVSYIEYLALSYVTPNRTVAMKRMPKALRAILQQIDGRQRWA